MQLFVKEKDLKVNELVDHVHSLNKVAKHKVGETEQIKLHLAAKDQELQSYQSQTWERH